MLLQNDCELQVKTVFHSNLITPLLYKTFEGFQGKDPVNDINDLDFNETETYFMSLSTDGEWTGGLNQKNEPLVLGYKLQSGKPTVLEHPLSGLGLAPTWNTIALPTYLLGWSDRLGTQDFTQGKGKNGKVTKKSTRPSIVVCNFIYFASPDFTMMFKAGLHHQLALCSILDQNRRVLMANQYQRPEFTGVILTDKKGIDYDLKVKVYDVCAMTGALGGYKESCIVADVKEFDREVKSFLDKYKGGREREAYIEHTEAFLEYNKNDLYVQEIALGMKTLWKKICQECQVNDISENLSLTHGSNVVKFCLATIQKLTGLSDEDIKAYGIVDSELLKTANEKGEVDDIKGLMELLNRDATSLSLAQKKDDTRYSLAAIDGGRCKNELPRRVKVTGVILDNDIDGCYGNGLMNQGYPLGRPTIKWYSHNELHKRPTIREVTSNVKNKPKGLDTNFYSDLIPGLFGYRVNTLKPLPFDQDLIASKLDLKPMTEDKLKKNKEYAEGTNGQDGNQGEVGGDYVLTLREIENGYINHDTLQVLLGVATVEEKKELLDNIVVNAIIYYPESERVDTFKEVLESVENEKGYWTHPKAANGTIDDRSKKWTLLPMDMGWVDTLLALRKSYPKKTPMNTFYKLIINCIYGVACSIFFPEFSNVVVANNITARARAMAWMMSKPNRGQQSITDGSMADLNNVLYWTGKRPGLHTLANLDDVSKLGREARKHLIVAPLNRHDIGNPNCPKYEVIGGYYRLVDADDASETLPLTIGEENKINQDFDNLNDPGKAYKLVTVMRQGEEVFEVSSGDTGIFDKGTWEHTKHFFRGLDIDILNKKGTKMGWDAVNKVPTRKPINGQYSFEGKDIYTSASFHSQSNYYAVQANNREVLKVRGTKLNATPYLDPHGTKELTKDDHSIRDLMKRILEGKKVPTYQKQYISVPLKVKEWNTRKDSKQDNAVKELFLMPGDSVSKANWLRPISPSMFRYKTIKQYKALTKYSDLLKDTCGYGLEVDYLDDDGLLDYEQTVCAIQDDIDNQLVVKINGKKDLATLPKHPYWYEATAKQLWTFDDKNDELNDIDW